MKPSKTPDFEKLRERALRYLARREHSRFELARKLELAGFPLADIAPLLDEFEQKEWLSDRRFAESWVADHRAKAGSVKLAHELRRRGVSDALIESILDSLLDSELARACEVRQKKFPSAPANVTEKVRQLRFLQSRGFTLDTAQRAIANGTEGTLIA